MVLLLILFFSIMAGLAGLGAWLWLRDEDLEGGVAVAFACAVVFAIASIVVGAKIGQAVSAAEVINESCRCDFTASELFWNRTTIMAKYRWNRL